MSTLPGTVMCEMYKRSVPLQGKCGLPKVCHPLTRFGKCKTQSREVMIDVIAVRLQSGSRARATKTYVTCRAVDGLCVARSRSIAAAVIGRAEK